MDFCNTICELHDCWRKSEEEKEELRVRLEHSQLTVIRLERELKARTTVVTRNANTQTMDAKVLDLPLVVPSTKEQSTRDMHSTSKMIFSELKSLIRGALSDDASLKSQNTAAGCSDRSSTPPDADSRVHLDISEASFTSTRAPPDADSRVHLDISEASFTSTRAPPDADSRVHLDISEASFTSTRAPPDADSRVHLDHVSEPSFTNTDAPPDAESRLCSNDIAQSSIEIQNLNTSLLPDSSLMDNSTCKQRRNQRTYRRKKENKQREAQRKVASSLEESLLPMQNELKPEADFVDLREPAPIEVEEKDDNSSPYSTFEPEQIPVDDFFIISDYVEQTEFNDKIILWNISSRDYGRVVGRDGKNAERLQLEYGVTIKVIDRKHGTSKVIISNGDAESRRAASEDIINNLPVIVECCLPTNIIRKQTMKSISYRCGVTITKPDVNSHYVTICGRVDDCRLAHKKLKKDIHFWYS